MNRHEKNICGCVVMLVFVCAMIIFILWALSTDNSNRDFVNTATKCQVIITDNNYYGIYVYNNGNWRRHNTFSHKDFAIEYCNDLIDKNKNRNRPVYVKQ